MKYKVITNNKLKTINNKFQKGSSQEEIISKMIRQSSKDKKMKTVLLEIRSILEVQTSSLELKRELGDTQNEADTEKKMQYAKQR